MDSDFVRIGLTLSGERIRKLMKGQTIQIKPEDMDGEVELVVSGGSIKKLQKARRLGKQVRLMLSPEERDMNLQGGSITDFLKKIGKTTMATAKKIKKEVIDTPLYQEKIKPLVREMVKQAVKKAPIPSIYEDKVNEYVDKVGKKTGAFGVGRGDGSYGSIMGSEAPVMKKKLPFVPIAQPKGGKKDKGGSFRPA
jgi:N-acyl-D-aspartate/D-glutamate deacylase